jgi:hypothetical protein
VALFGLQNSIWRVLILRSFITRKITYKRTNGYIDEVCRLQSVKLKTKREWMNLGCNRSLNVFQPTPPLYYNNGVCQYKRGAASYSYIFSKIFSDCNVFLTLWTDLVHEIRAQYSAYCQRTFITMYFQFISTQ